jgi:hypothetical protein
VVSAGAITVKFGTHITRRIHLNACLTCALPPPLSLSCSTAIQKLSLASNNLRGLPDEIAACTTLEELYLSNNAKFSYFPGSAGHLRWVWLLGVVGVVGVLCCTSSHFSRVASRSVCGCKYLRGAVVATVNSSPQLVMRYVVAVNLRRKLKELSLAKCPALKQLPNTSKSTLPICCSGAGIALRRSAGPELSVADVYGVIDHPVVLIRLCKQMSPDLIISFVCSI